MTALRTRGLKPIAVAGTLVGPARSRYAPFSSITGSSRCWRCDRPANVVTRICRPRQQTPSSAVSSAPFAAIVPLTGLVAAAPIAGAIWSSARSAPRTSWRPIPPPPSACSNRRDAATPPEIGLPLAGAEPMGSTGRGC